MNVAEYLACFENTWPDDAPLDQVRFVVLDSETTGLDPHRDKLITIGAVTVHGITRDETLGGIEEEAALNVAYEKHPGFELRNRSLDTMDLALHLNDGGAFANQPMAQGFGLDELCDRFQIPAHGSTRRAETRLSRRRFSCGCCARRGCCRRIPIART